jgi:lipoprotein-anchoring transpeptidase ErfK/SrfK
VHNALRSRSSLVLVTLTVAVATLVSACSSGSGKPAKTVTKTASNGSVSTQTTPASPTAPKTTAPPASPVHVEGFPADGTTVGVGMPIIADFNKKITDAHGFAKNTTVTVNGQPANGAWYFEYSDPKSGHVMEAHYRTAKYWPAHARIHVAFNLKGVSAGTGLAFDGKLTSLDFQTGAAHIVVVSNRTHRLTVTSDGHQWGSFPVSLGATNTPTLSGTKVIMEKLTSVCMSGNPPNAPAYHECGVKWDQRLTYGGEYLHAAPWNVANIMHGVNSSNGCTNLLTADAEKLYKFLSIGDPVEYPDATGSQMTIGEGYGDWNVNWPTWQTGGALATS